MGTTLHTNRIVLLCLAALPVAAALVVAPDGRRALEAAAWLGLAAHAMIRPRPDAPDLPACAYLPLLALVSGGIILCWHGPEVWADAAANARGGIVSLDAFGRPLCGGLLWAGIATAIVGVLRSASPVWLTGVSAGCLGSAFILNAWSNAEPLSLEFVAGGRAVLGCFVLCTALWTAMLEAATIVAPGRRTANLWMGACLLVGGLAVCLAARDSAARAALALVTAVGALPQGPLAWGPVTLACLALFGWAYAMHNPDAEDGRLGADSFVAASCALTLIALRVLASRPLPHGWLVVALLACLLLIGLADEVSGDAQDSFGVLGLALLGLSCVVSLVMLGAGLALNLVVTMAWLVAATWLSGRGGKRPAVGRGWALTLALVICEALAWLVQRHLSGEGLALLALVSLAAGMTLRVIVAPRPTGFAASPVPPAAVCASCALLCAVIAWPTVSVDLSSGAGASVALVRMEVAPTTGSPHSASCVWLGGFGEEVSGTISLIVGVNQLSVESGVLRVVVVDGRGARCERLLWCLDWLSCLGLGDG